MTAAREGDGTKAILEDWVPGFEYGVTRLNRTQIKRLFTDATPRSTWKKKAS